MSVGRGQAPITRVDNQNASGYIMKHVSPEFRARDLIIWMNMLFRREYGRQFLELPRESTRSRIIFFPSTRVPCSRGTVGRIFRKPAQGLDSPDYESPSAVADIAVLALLFEGLCVGISFYGKVIWKTAIVEIQDEMV